MHCGKSSDSWVNLRCAFPLIKQWQMHPRRHSRQRDCFGFSPNSLLGCAKQHRRHIFNQFIISALYIRHNKNRVFPFRKNADFIILTILINNIFAFHYALAVCQSLRKLGIGLYAVEDFFSLVNTAFLAEQREEIFVIRP